MADCMLKLQMYPVDHYTDLELIDRKWAECLEQDKAFVHTALFTGSAIQDYALQRPFSTITSMHLHQTLHHLRILLSSSAPQNVRTIAFIILSLCIVASIYGDIKVLNVHMAGLWRLLSARGQSCESFFSPRIMCKRDRLELSAYACGGLKPSLPIGPFSWKPVYRTRLLKSQGGSSSAYHKILGPDSDARLGGVFYDVRYLATEIRDSATTGSQIQGSRFRESFYSVQSRLIHLEDDLGDPWAECLRLGLLACLMANFRVPNRRIAGAQLVQKARDVCRLVTAHTLGQRDLLAWFLMVCVISICEPEDDWVTAKWQPCAPPPETSYAVFKEETLRQVVWIDCVYDEIGIQVFHRLQKSMRTR